MTIGQAYLWACEICGGQDKDVREVSGPLADGLGEIGWAHEECEQFCRKVLAEQRQDEEMTAIRKDVSPRTTGTWSDGHGTEGTWSS